MTALTKRRIRVVGGAVRDGERWLAARRSATMSDPLAWEFPGGKVEPGESDEAALARELREELGIGVQVGRHIATSVVEREAVCIELAVYEASILTGTAHALEHAELAWFGPRELCGLEWAEADIPIVKALLADSR